MSNENEYKIKLICSPHDGSRNNSFLKFKRDFRSAAQAEVVKGDSYNAWQAMNDLDQGGQGAGAPPLPGGAAGNAALRVLDDYDKLLHTNLFINMSKTTEFKRC